MYFFFTAFIIFCQSIQTCSSISRVFCGQDASPHVLPHHARAQPRLERGAVRRGPLHQRLWLGAETCDGPDTMGCRHRQWLHIWGTEMCFTCFCVSLTTVCNCKCFPLLVGICIAAWSHLSFLTLKLSSSNSHNEELLVICISNSLFIKLRLYRTLHFHVSLTLTAFFSFYSLRMKGAHPYSPAVWGLKLFIYSLQAHE